MSQKIFKKVRRFVSDVTLKPLTQIKPETSLYFDLDLTLDTAPAFFARFAEAFNVELQGMELRPYFDPRTYGTLGSSEVEGLFQLFRWLTKDRHGFNGVKPLLVSDLVRLAQARRWCL